MRLGRDGKQYTPTPKAPETSVEVSDPAECTPKQRAATQRALEKLNRFADFCKSNDPNSMSIAVLRSEVPQLKRQIRLIDAWLDSFVTSI